MNHSEKAPELEPIPKSIMNNACILVLGAIMPLLDSTMVNIAIKHLLIPTLFLTNKKPKYTRKGVLFNGKTK